MAGKTQQRSDVRLPWERRSAWLSQLASGRRWRALLLALCLAAVMFGLYTAARRRERIRLTRAAIAEVQRAVAVFRAKVGRCPRSTVELVHPPRAAAQYLDVLPDDGWGRQLLVRCPGRVDRNSAEVISSGPSGSFSVDDNIY
jgi:type II secretory pathway pseudopilin PulG